MKFDAKKETEKIIEFIRDYYKKYNLKGVVLGISGGKDSGVVAGLFSKALGSENVVGITLPCHSKNTDATDAKLVSNKYGFELINIDLTKTFDTFKNEISLLGNFSENELLNSDINIKPRLRMSACYYIAALYSELKHGTYLVAGTSNKLGVKYKDIASVINGKKVSKETKCKVDKLHTNNLHKFNIPVYERD